MTAIAVGLQNPGVSALIRDYLSLSGLDAQVISQASLYDEACWANRRPDIVITDLPPEEAARVRLCRGLRREVLEGEVSVLAICHPSLHGVGSPLIQFSLAAAAVLPEPADLGQLASVVRRILATRAQSWQARKHAADLAGT